MTTTQKDNTTGKASMLPSSEVSESFWHDFRALFKHLRQQPQPSVPPDKGAPEQVRETILMRSTLHALAALTLVASAASAQSWQTVQDFGYIGGAGASGLTIDPFGNLFVAGWGFDTNGGNNISHALMTKSSDGGITWQLSDDFTTAPTGAFYGAGLTAISPAITSDGLGNVYAVGRYGATGGGNVWFAAQSTNSGASWNNVDAAGPEAWAYGVGADSAGNVYAVGRTNATVITTTSGKHGTTTTTNTIFSWLVRKGSNGGTSWSTVDLMIPGASGGSHATATFCHPTLGTFVTGNYSSNGAAFLWTTRRSLDGGATWTMVDSAIAGTGFGIGADALGNIYVAGTSQDFYHWLVRKSSDGGASWTTVDDQTSCATVTNSLHPLRTTTTCYDAEASSFVADSNGNLFVAGFMASPNGNKWIVRENPGGNTSWQTVDSFQYSDATKVYSTSAYGITADSSGHVYVAGLVVGGSLNNTHWVVRKR